LHLYRSQNVQVLGITIDDPRKLAEWSRTIGVTFPLLADSNGQVTREFELFDAQTNRAARAFVVIHEGAIVRSERVTTTEIPDVIAPWIERLR
jgi:alkyl hydroperoxide reductase subunit AhpC